MGQSDASAGDDAGARKSAEACDGCARDQGREGSGPARCLVYGLLVRMGARPLADRAALYLALTPDRREMKTAW